LGPSGKNILDRFVELNQRDLIRQGACEYFLEELFRREKQAAECMKNLRILPGIHSPALRRRVLF
jgi:hypothetical protein